MMLKENEILNHVAKHGPQWSTYNLVKFKKEFMQSIVLIDNLIKKNKESVRHGNTN